MDNERKRRVEEIFAAAADLQPDKRRSFLDDCCRADDALRAEIDSLLSFDDPADRFLESPLIRTAFAQIAPATGDADLESPVPIAHCALPTRIGRYEIVRRLGEGGMGVVYEATQDNPHRTIALKVIKPGLASTSLLKRFQRESDVLGRLHHPGIAHIYEAGVHLYDPADPRSGVPFFAMEFIQGRPLTEYAADKQLDLSRRLALIAMICDAVHHAHTHGVVHRDLKPANILVIDEASPAPPHNVFFPPLSEGGPGGVGVPKILDFGVARAADADMHTITLQTDIGQIIGTVPYMSPEQVAGDPNAVDARSDVYAIGVMMYELLAGKLPHDVRGRSIPEAARIIREDEPSRLSSVNPMFRGDVETIVAKALDKDKTRRYQSAAELAGDIRRFLRDEPIVARPTSALYQLRKFAKRNRGLVGGVLATILALVAGLAGMTWLAMRESEQRSLAEKNAAVAQTNEDQARQSAYRAHLAAAQTAFQHGDATLAQRTLNDAPESLRGWEWNLLRRLVDSSTNTFQLDVKNLRRVVLTPDGDRIVTQDDSSIIRIWSSLDGTLLGSLDTGDQANALNSAGPGARYIATWKPNVISIWNPANGARLWNIDIRDGGGGVGNITDADFVTYTRPTQGTVMFLDLLTGIETGSVPSASVYAFLSPDGRYIAGYSDDGFGMMNSGDGQFLWRIPGDHGWFRTYSNDSRLIAYSSRRQPDTLQIMDTAGGELRASLESRLSADSQVDFRTDNETIIGVRADVITVWDIQSATRIATLHANPKTRTVAFTSDGERIVAVDNDARVRQWHGYISANPFVFETTFGGHAAAAAIDRNARLVATGDWGAVTLWDPTIGTARWHRFITTTSVRAIAFSRDASRIAADAARGVITVLDTRDGTIMARSDRRPGYSVVSLLWLSDGQTVIAGCDDGMLRQFRMTGPSLELVTEVLSHIGAVAALALNPDGDRLASVSDGTGHRDRNAVPQAPPGPDFAIRIWNAADLKPLCTLDDLQQPARSVVFINDGRTLAVGSSNRSVILYDALIGKRLNSLTGPTAAAVSLAEHPDRSRLAALCEDGNIHLWELHRGDEVGVMKLDHGCGFAEIRFTPDGNTAVAAGCTITTLFESRQPPDAILKQRDRALRARSVMEATFRVHQLAEDAVRALETDPNLAEPVRQDALDMARRRGDQAMLLNSFAWGEAVYPNLNPERYQTALRVANAAVAVMPDTWSLLNTLAVAQYRAGKYQAAVETLSRCEALHRESDGEPHPVDLTFLAMSQLRLGDIAAAKKSLSSARRLHAAPQYAADPESDSFLKEAEQLINPQ